MNKITNLLIIQLSRFGAWFFRMLANIVDGLGKFLFGERWGIAKLKEDGCMEKLYQMEYTSKYMNEYECISQQPQQEQRSSLRYDKVTGELYEKEW